MDEQIPQISSVWGTALATPKFIGNCTYGCKTPLFQCSFTLFLLGFGESPKKPQTLQNWLDFPNGAQIPAGIGRGEGRVQLGHGRPRNADCDLSTAPNTLPGNLLPKARGWRGMSSWNGGIRAVGGFTPQYIPSWM